MFSRIIRIAVAGSARRTMHAVRVPVLARARLMSSAAQQLQPNPSSSLQSPVVALSACNRFLVLDEPKQQLAHSRFPLLWLRDNCQCSQCCHTEVNRRILDWTTFERPQGLKLQSFKHNEQDNTVRLHWTDGHESTYSVDFLKSHRFDEANTKQYLRTEYRLPKVPWSKKNTDFQMPRFSLDEIMHNPDGKEMKRWLTGLCKTGMGILENKTLPNRPELINEFINKVFGFCKQTHYGQEFTIQTRVSGNITNIAYLNGNLQLHTDLPYYSYNPGVTVLHYLKQSQFGGLSMLVDGFQLAERMRREEPEAFEVLSRVPVNFVDKGVENSLKFHKIYVTPVIALKHNGDLDRISFSVPHRDSMFSVSDPELVHRWYEAMQIFLRFSREEVLEFKMNENDFLIFDNTRLLHGRTAYEAYEQRTIQGCYVDWDEIYSKYRATEQED